MGSGPKYECTGAPTAKRLDDGTFTFNLSAFADWSTGSGFALVPEAGPASTFRLTFWVSALAAD